MKDHFTRRRRMALAVLSIGESVVVLVTFASIRPEWSAQYYERMLRRIAVERRA